MKINEPSLGDTKQVLELVTHKRDFLHLDQEFTLTLTQKLNREFNIGHYNYVIELKGDVWNFIIDSRSSIGGAPDTITNKDLTRIIEDFRQSYDKRYSFSK